MTSKNRAPVAIGVGTVTQRLDPATLPGLGAVGLMAEAARRAIDDAGVPEVVDSVDVVLVPRGTWLHADAGRAVANAIGASPVRSVSALIGVLQQTLITRACHLVAQGEARAVLVVGAEAMARSKAAARAGYELQPDASGNDLPGPDEVLRPATDIITRMEIERHLGVPVRQYALIESVLAHRAGRTPRQQQQHVAALWALASEVAAGQPDAWTRDPWDAHALADESNGNRMLASPYRRWCVSDWNVDQAAALLVTSSRVAGELGVPVQRWVAPVAAAETNHMLPLPARDDLAASPAWRLIGAELASLGGAPPATADHLDLYSCFPAAVQVAALELGISLDAGRRWTVTGGMTFGGGPLNSYALQSTAEMVRRLRSTHGATGLVTCVSGMLTKVAGAMWRAGEPRAPFLSADVSEREAALTRARHLRPDLTGEATVVAATVLHDRGEPTCAVAVVEDGDGNRSVAASEDPVRARSWVDVDVIGHVVQVEPAGVLV